VQGIAIIARGTRENRTPPCDDDDVFYLLKYRVPHGSQSLDSYYRPTAGKSSSPAGLSTLVYEYVVDCATASRVWV
jgi:hypothetical protein